MDINDLGALVTVVFFVVFVAIVVWAYSKHQKKRFDEAAKLPFQEEDARLGGDSGPGRAGPTPRP